MFKNLKSSIPKIFDNTEEKLSFVTPCKLDNLLRKFEETQKNKQRLLVSSGVCFPTLTTLVTTSDSSFNNFLGFSSSTWQAFFFLLCITSFCMTLYSLYGFYKKNNFSREELIESLFNRKNKLKI